MMSADLRRKQNWIYSIIFGVLCFALGCLYLTDIRIDEPPVAFGLNLFKWLHIGLLIIAVCAGLVASSSQCAILIFVIMIISEIAGISIWVGHTLLSDPSNNLWPLGLILFSACGAIAISVGVLTGFLLGNLLKKSK